MKPWTDDRARALLLRLFEAAVRSADPGAAVRQHLPAKPRGRCVVVGAGKGAAAMAAAVDAAWPDVDVSGVVVTRHGQARPAGRIEVITAAHPVPDEHSVQAGRRLLSAVQGLGADDLVLALISGGGSSLLVLPAGQMTLADKQQLNLTLLASGANIREMNVLRRQLSGIKGGGLAAAVGDARLVTLIVSDVPGDDPAAVASGPTIPDPSTREQAREIVARYCITLPAAAQAVLDAPAPRRAARPHDVVKVIAAPMMALQAAAAQARAEGLTPLILGDALEGEAAQMGQVLSGIARSVARFGLPVPRPAVLLSGGEATVTLGDAHVSGPVSARLGQGAVTADAGQEGGAPVGAQAGPRGGRNTECLLAMALALSGEPGIWALACDSDGVDGMQDAAGALITPDSLHRAHGAGLDARTLLGTHDSYRFFDGLGDLVRTGPTGTNVNDIRAILVT